MKLRSLLRHINLLNLLLLAVLLFVLRYLLLPMATADVRYVPSTLKKAAEAEEPAPGGAPPAQAPSLMEYTVIAEQNLFHPERHIPPEKKEAPPPPKPEFVLYGTTISDEMTIAYMEDQKAPQSTPGRGKRQVAIKKGDSISGFVLKEVEPEKVVLVRGEERMEVFLNDNARPKKREAVVTTSSAPPAGTAQVAPPQRTPPAPAQQPAAAVTAPAGTAQPKASAPAAAAPTTQPSTQSDKESARRAFTDLFKRGRTAQ